MMLVQNRELNLLGSQMYQRVDYEQAVELIARNEVHLEELVTHHFPLTQYRAAYDYIERNQDRAMKVMITF
jgi:L-iditol 2-dehydrogenase